MAGQLFILEALDGEVEFWTFQGLGLSLGGDLDSSLVLEVGS